MNPLPKTPSPFFIADPELIYLDGNSLGRLPLAAADRLQTLIREGWGRDLISGWNRDWIGLPARIGDKIGYLIGAKRGQCIVADSTSVNLFKLATAALKARPDRQLVITDRANFPSDLYVLESACRAAGHSHRVELVGAADHVEPDTDAILGAIDHNTALVSLSHVTFRSGAVYPMREITDAAHAVGAMVLWDLSHSVGVVPMQLDDWNVDLAVGCTYKYLCGGPGSPAFLYVRSEIQAQLESVIAGWFSHAAPFAFDTAYQPIEGIQKFLTGTPPVISLAAIEAGVDLVAQVGVDFLRGRSVALSEKMIRLFDERLSALGFKLRSPRAPEFRGSHISLGHPQARKITQTLIERHKVVPDFRAPDNLRLGFAPLYTTEDEVQRAAEAIVEIVSERQYEEVQIDNCPVT